MEQRIKIGTATVRQIPFDFSGNRDRILTLVADARRQGVSILLLPELSLTGYGCEDNFTYPDFLAEVEASLSTLITEMRPLLSTSMVVSVGLPLAYPGGQVFNASALISSQGLHGFTCKQFLARNGLHYEPRWFSAWPRGITKTHPTYQVPMGDVVFNCDGVRIGFETCEDSWVSNRPGRDLYQRNVDVILNPSASHFAVGKYETRLRFVREGSRAFGVAYAYANLSGCENGTSIFDGGCIIASEGEVVNAGPRFIFTDGRVNTAVVSLYANRSTRSVNSEALINNDKDTVNVPLSFAYEDPWAPEDAATGEGDFLTALAGRDGYFTELCYAVATGLWDWHQRTGTNGFVISLSGGADSGLAAVFVELAYRLARHDMGKSDFLRRLGLEGAETDLLDGDNLLRYVMARRLSCAYQGTEQSGDVTLMAANALASGLGAAFYHWDISSQVAGYITLFDQDHPSEPLCWESDDIALQNIQARTRSPSIWLLSNRQNKLLIATSNLSESALGYATMDGDTSGVLAPLSGISKSTIRSLNVWLEQQGVPLGDNDRVKYPSLHAVNVQAPTAELRPGHQVDEDDLMPYEICDFIMDAYLIKKLWPKNILCALCRAGFEKQFSRRVLAGFVEKWFTLFCRNPWKRYGTRAGFHLEQMSLDPKTFHRFPLLNSGFKEPLKAMWDTLE